MEEYVVLNKKELKGDALKNKIQTWIEGAPCKAGDKVKLDPNKFSTKESIALGWIEKVSKK